MSSPRYSSPAAPRRKTCGPHNSSGRLRLAWPPPVCLTAYPSLRGATAPFTFSAVCSQARMAAAVECIDTKDWDNGEGQGCQDYSEYCQGGGFRLGSEWAGGERYHHPEHNCCVCGKPLTGEYDAIHSVALPTAAAPQHCSLHLSTSRPASRLRRVESSRQSWARRWRGRSCTRRRRTGWRPARLGGGATQSRNCSSSPGCRGWATASRCGGSGRTDHTELTVAPDDCDVTLLAIAAAPSLARLRLRKASSPQD